MNCDIRSTAMSISWLLAETCRNMRSEARSIDDLRMLCVERLSSHFTCPDACLEQRVDAFLRAAASSEVQTKMARHKGEP